MDVVALLFQFSSRGGCTGRVACQVMGLCEGNSRFPIRLLSGRLFGNDNLRCKGKSNDNRFVAE